MGSRKFAVKGGGRKERIRDGTPDTDLFVGVGGQPVLINPRGRGSVLWQTRNKGGKNHHHPLPKDASGEDVYPDCNRGKVCLPEAEQCATRQQKIGALQYNPDPSRTDKTKTYWVSWHSNEQVLRDARWNWFSARNYCRKRCMDLVSFENDGEWSLLKGFMEKAGVKE